MIQASSGTLAQNAAQPAWEAFLARNHFGSLDGLRCVSIAAVIWHHGPGSGYTGLLSRGSLGVHLFFAISGFLITTLLLRERQRNGAISLARFYARRVLRIFPLYYTVLAAYAVLALTVLPSADATEFFGNFPYFLTYTFNWMGNEFSTFGFAWSLAAEEQFYGTWPLVLSRFSIGVSTWVMACLCGIALWYDRADHLPIAITSGSLLALTLHSRHGYRAVWAVLGRRWMPWLVLAALIASLSITAVRQPSWAHLLLVLLVGTCVIREDHGMARLLSLRGAAYVGTISYGMYMLHGLVLAALNRFGWNTHTAPGILLGATLTILTASLSYRYFESPFLRWKQRFEVARSSALH